MRSCKTLFTPLTLGLAVTAVAPAQAADPGAAIFARSCAVCHATVANAPKRIGPNLSGVAGRKAASLPDFAYSPAMTKSGLVWNQATLDRFLTKPSALVPGNRMGFAGVASPTDRAALVKYLLAAK